MAGVRRRRAQRRRTWHSRPLRLPSLERGTLADRAADGIRTLILTGRVAPGQRLEPMRDLADELGVSLPVVREATAQLKGEGLLEVKHGLGTYVARRPSAATSLRAARRRASRQEAAELRRSVDPAVARAAAGRASDHSITEMHFALGERRVALMSGDPVAFTEADLAFHLAVAKAAGNGLGIGIHRLGARLLKSELAARALEHARNHELTDLHGALAEAIELGRPGQAERAARAIAAIEARPP